MGSREYDEIMRVLENGMVAERRIPEEVAVPLLDSWRASIAVIMEAEVGVASSNISSIQLMERKKLVVAFKSGGVYLYEGVSPEVFEKFFTAHSAGKFFHANIKNKYPTTKMS